jgi:hypothetical protein
MCLPLPSLGRVPLAGSHSKVARPEPNYLIAKLQQFTRLWDTGHIALHEVSAQWRWVGAHVDIIHGGQPHGPIRVILYSWANRYKSSRTAATR